MRRLHAFACVLGLALAFGCTHSPRPRSAKSTRAAPKSDPADRETLEKDIAELIAPVLAEAPERRAIGVVLIDEDETFVFGFGPRNRTNSRPMDADTTFEIGSVAKSMVGVLLADAVQRGEVALDDPAEKFLPEGFALGPKLRPVTLAHLATLTTGFPWFPDNWVGVDPVTRKTRYTLDAFREFLRTFEPDQAPGERFRYSATDTALLALVLSERTHTPFPKLLKQRLFQRLGMTQSEYADHPEQSANRLDGYDAEGDLRAARIDESPLGPCCAIRSTLGDMGRYLRAALGSESPLKVAFARSQEPRFPLDSDGLRKMALGWETNARFDSVSKNGVVEGYRTSALLYPKLGQGVFVVVNSESVNADGVARDIAAWELQPEPVGLTDHGVFVVKELPTEAKQVTVQFGDYIRLEGVQAPSCVRPGETLTVTFYYRCVTEMARDYRVFVHAEAQSGGAARLRGDHFPNGGKGSTIQWLEGELVRDEFSIPIPKDYASKAIVLWNGLFDESGRLAASVEAGEDEVVDDRLRGPTIAVGPCP